MVHGRHMACPHCGVGQDGQEVPVGLCPWRCSACGHINMARHQTCRGSPSGAGGAGTGASSGSGGPSCGHLRSITGGARAEFQGNDWVCPRCLEQVDGTDEKPPRMWPKVPMCRRCRGLKEDLDQVFGILLVRDFIEGFEFSS